MANIQTTKLQKKGDLAVCSEFGTVEELAHRRSWTLEESMSYLEEYKRKYGVNSREFFNLVKPLIAWTCYKHLRGMPFSEDLVNYCYAEIVLAFEGGWTEHYNKRKKVEPTFPKSKRNIGAFIMYVVGGAVSKYRSKHYRRQSKYENREEDVMDKTNFTNFETENFLTYYVKEDFDVQHFDKFTFNTAFTKHLDSLKNARPRNNILYNFMLWRSQCVN